jgi:sugar/nucleoside kinase (ribokinase family)
VGAGDSLAAGFALKSEEQGDVTLLESIDWELSLKFGIATAAASCEKGRSGEVDPARVEALFSLRSST